MNHPLLQQHPAGIALVTEFCDQHPDLLPIRRARSYIASLASQPEAIQRIFRKRFNRWHVHIPSLIEYFELEESLVDVA